MANLAAWLPIQSSIVSQNMNPSNWQSSSLFGNTGNTQSTRYNQPTDSYNSSNLFSLNGSQQSNQDQTAGLLQLISAMLLQLLSSSQQDAQAAPFSLTSDETKATSKQNKSKSHEEGGGCQGKSKTNKAQHDSKTTKTKEADKTGSSCGK